MVHYSRPPDRQHEAAKVVNFQETLCRSGMTESGGTSLKRTYTVAWDRSATGLGGVPQEMVSQGRLNIAFYWTREALR